MVSRGRARSDGGSRARRHASRVRARSDKGEHEAMGEWWRRPIRRRPGRQNAELAEVGQIPGARWRWVSSPTGTLPACGKEGGRCGAHQRSLLGSVLVSLYCRLCSAASWDLGAAPREPLRRGDSWPAVAGSTGPGGGHGPSCGRGNLGEQVEGTCPPWPPPLFLPSFVVLSTGLIQTVLCLG